MFELLILFIRVIGRVAVIFSGASFVGILLLDRIFGGFEFYLGMLVLIAPLVAWATTLQLVPKNLEWILTLPFAKRDVVLLNYVTSMIASFVIGGCAFVVLFVLVLLKSGLDVRWSQLGNVASNLRATDPVVSNYLAGIDIYGWMTAFLMLSFFHALSISISKPASTKRFYLNLWSHHHVVVRWLVRAGWIGGLALAAVFREVLLAPIGIFFVSVAVFMVLTTLHTTHAVGASKRQRWVWVGSALLIAAVEFSFLLGQAIHGVGSADFDRRVASVIFLGPFSGVLRKPALAELLQTPIGRERIQELGEIYRRTFHGGSKIRASEDSDLSVASVVEKKKSVGDVLAAARLFEASSLRFGDVRVILQKLESLKKDCRCEPSVQEFLGAQVSEAETLELLESSIPLEVSYGLMRARIRRSSAYAQVINRRFPLLADSSKQEALKTLAFLYGARGYSLNDWIRNFGLRAFPEVRSLASGGLPSPRFFEADCRQYRPSLSGVLTETEIVRLNLCTRETVEPSMAREVELAGWLEPPFEAHARSLIRRVFHLR